LNPDAIFSTLDSIEPTTIGHFIAEHLPQETFVHRNKIVGSFLAGLMFTLAAGAVGAQTRLKASLAVGGSSSQIVLLAMNIARTKGFIRDEGLDLEVTDFGSGAKGLQALIGRNVDMTIGVYEHTIRMQAKGMDIRSVVLHSNAPGIAIAITKQFAAKYKGPKDLKGTKIGLSAPGSATHLLLNQFLVQHGVLPNEVSVIGVGNTAGAVAAIRTGGELQAIVNYDPVITELVLGGDVQLLLDLRALDATRQFFKSDFAFLSTYAHADYIAKNPAVIQALVNGTVRALLWMRTAKPEDILAAVPEEHWRTRKDLYLETIRANLGGFSQDGMLLPDAAKTVLEGLLSYDKEVKSAKIDLDKTYDNRFVMRALAKFRPQ
jgi:NitT/TauT family transport system substrate-binding protein